MPISTQRLWALRVADVQRRIQAERYGIRCWWDRYHGGFLGGHFHWSQDVSPGGSFEEWTAWCKATEPLVETRLKTLDARQRRVEYIVSRQSGAHPGR